MQASITSDDDGRYMATIKCEDLSRSRTFAQLKTATSWLERMQEEAKQIAAERAARQAAQEAAGSEWSSALTTREMVEVYPTICTTERKVRRWWFERDKNGLTEARCAAMTKQRKLLWLPEKTLSWYLNLKQ